MRKIYIILSYLLIITIVQAQSPEKMSYQAVIRNANNTIVANQTIGMRISIIQGNATGTVEYIETYNPKPKTNTNGLVIVEIGSGIPEAGTLDAINWANGPFFIKTETDPKGGVNYSIIGTSQLLSVPYAFYAKTAENGFSGNYNDLNNKPPVFDGNYDSLYNKPLLFDGQYTSLTGKPIFALVATSGNYNDLLSRPSGNKIGDMLYWNGTFWAVIPVGKPGEVLHLTSSNLPAWSVASNPLLITTLEVTEISETTALCGGNLISEGGSAITACGICWSTLQTPSLTDNKTNDGGGSGNFVSILYGLTPGTTYYVRAYAINSSDTGYGAIVSFITQTAGTTITDYDGNSYKTVTIGTQCWMAENLKVTHYRNGDPIPNVSNSKIWETLTTGASSDNNNLPSNSAIYGKLYNFYTVVDPRNVCPNGWHVPFDAEWTLLIDYLGGENFAGGKLKETGIEHWQSPNNGATNSSGFTALSGGWRLNNGEYYVVAGIGTFWWSSTLYNSNAATNRYLYNDYPNVSRNFSDLKYGLSIRCVKD